MCRRRPPAPDRCRSRSSARSSRHSWRRSWPRRSAGWCWNCRRPRLRLSAVSTSTPVHSARLWRMPPFGTTAVKVPLALDAAACTELPVPVSTARASSTPRDRLVGGLDEVLGMDVGDARIHGGGRHLLARIDLDRAGQLALGEAEGQRLEIQHAVLHADMGVQAGEREVARLHRRRRCSPLPHWSGAAARYASRCRAADICSAPALPCRRPPAGPDPRKSARRDASLPASGRNLLRGIHRQIAVQVGAAQHRH